MSLLSTRRFLPLFVAQFLGAFNDNFFKSALVMLITFRSVSILGLPAPLLVTICSGLFILPFFLFSALAGQLADAHDRTRIARIVKLSEIALMLLGWVGFYFSNLPLLLLVLFGMGVHSTFFGPIKYAILPQHLHERELLSGNAYIEAGTFLAILLGTLGGGLLVLHQPNLFGFAAIACAAMGYLSSRIIPPAPAPAPGTAIRWNIFRETAAIIKHAIADPMLRLCILGISWFWFIGATFLSQFPAYSKLILHADETVVTLLLTVFSVGIGIGSFLCNIWLRGSNRIHHVKWVMALISVFTIDFALVAPTIQQEVLMDASLFLHTQYGLRIMADLLMVAILGGLYIVPLYTRLQEASEPGTRARTIAANNVVNAAFMVLSALSTLALLASEFSISQIFLFLGVVNLLATCLMFRSGC